MNKTMTLFEQVKSYNEEENTILTCYKCNKIDLKYYDYKETDIECDCCHQKTVVCLSKSKYFDSVIEAARFTEMNYNSKEREGKNYNLIEFSISLQGDVIRTVTPCKMVMSGSGYYKQPTYHIRFENGEKTHGYSKSIIHEEEMYKPIFVAHELNGETRGVSFAFENQDEEMAKKTLIEEVQKNLSKYIPKAEMQLENAKMAYEKLMK